MSATTASPHKPRLAGQAWRVYLEPASLRMLALGFSAGLPLLLVLGTLSFWLREAGIDRTTIGHLSWVGLAYGFKWVWAPLVDRLPLPLLTTGCSAPAQLAAAVAAGHHGWGWPAWPSPIRAARSRPSSGARWRWRLRPPRRTSRWTPTASNRPTERQAPWRPPTRRGYRLAMIWAGAGVLWIAARAEVANRRATTSRPPGRRPTW
jgi:PAT family beta-lactamase induction signal transducer AmpG